MSNSLDEQMLKVLQVLANTPEVLFAVLVGSRANGSVTENSDWDIALQWR